MGVKLSVEPSASNTEMYTMGFDGWGCVLVMALRDGVGDARVC